MDSLLSSLPCLIGLSRAMFGSTPGSIPLFTHTPPRSPYVFFSARLVWMIPVPEIIVDRLVGEFGIGWASVSLTVD